MRIEQQRTSDKPEDRLTRLTAKAADSLENDPELRQTDQGIFVMFAKEDGKIQIGITLCGLNDKAVILERLHDLMHIVANG